MFISFLLKNFFRTLKIFLHGFFHSNVHYFYDLGLTCLYTAILLIIVVLDELQLLSAIKVLIIIELIVVSFIAFDATIIFFFQQQVYNYIISIIQRWKHDLYLKGALRRVNSLSCGDGIFPPLE